MTGAFLDEAVRYDYKVIFAVIEVIDLDAVLDAPEVSDADVILALYLALVFETL